jgi:hypothetical protein
LIERRNWLARTARVSSLTLPGVQPRTRFWIAPVFTVSAKAYRQFLARLGAPPKPNKRLLKSMQTPSPWECACLFRLLNRSATIIRLKSNKTGR